MIDPEARVDQRPLLGPGGRIPAVKAVAVERQGGVAALRRYFRTYAALAREYGVGCILESPTWRASADLGSMPCTAFSMTRSGWVAIILLNGVYFS